VNVSKRFFLEATYKGQGSGRYYHHVSGGSTPGMETAMKFGSE
jgi:hypothetical protein